MTIADLLYYLLLLREVWSGTDNQKPLNVKIVYSLYDMIVHGRLCKVSAGAKDQQLEFMPVPPSTDEQS